MITHESIISAIEKHCLDKGIAPTTFGLRAVNDGKLLTRLRGGRSISIDTYNRIMQLIESDSETAS